MVGSHKWSKTRQDDPFEFHVSLNLIKIYAKQHALASCACGNFQLAILLVQARRSLLKYTQAFVGI